MSEMQSTAPVDVTPAPVVVTPVAAPIATPEPVSTAEQVDAPEGESPEAIPEKTLTQSQVNKIVQKEKAQASRQAEKLVEARLRAEYAERERDALAAKLNPQPETPSGEPTPAQFQDYESYIRAFNKWNVKEELKQEREALQKQHERQRAQQEIEKVAVTAIPKLERGREKYDDFDEVVQQFVANTPQAAHDALLESERTDDLLYFLGQNPAERDRIFRLSNVGQVKAITALEAKLTATPSPTRTPAPIVPNNGKSPVSKHWQDMNTEEFFEYRRKRIAAKRGR